MTTKYTIHYVQADRKKGIKIFYADTKEGAKYKFKFLYPDYLILKIEEDGADTDKLCELCNSELHKSTDPKYDYYCSVCGSHFKHKKQW